MQIPGPIPTPSTLTLPNAAPALPWQVGQRVDAQVITLIGPGRVALKIGGTLFEAHTALPAAIGQQLPLEVVRADEQVVLRVLSPAPQDNTLTAALREALPRQEPLQAAFSGFSALLSSSPGLAPGIVMALNHLLAHLPAQQNLTQANVLKQALLDSGLFLEHKLGADPQPAAVTADLKANLLRLLAATARESNDSAHTLAQHVAGGLARIQLHQLSALADAQSLPAAWSGELPVRDHNHVDVFQFHIEKDAKNAAQPGQQSWSTWLSFNIKSLGPMYVKLTLTSNSVTAVLWAELDSTVALVKHNLEHLHQTLSRAGLNLKEVQCLHGCPPFPASRRLPSGLLDIIA